MGVFNKDMSVEEILDIMNDSKANTEIMHAGPCFLQYKLHQELLEGQRRFQRRQLSRTFWLVFATWTMAIANIVLALFNLR